MPSSAIPYVAACCESCSDPTTVNIPGPAGAAGAAGAVGATGQNAYTVTTANFDVPAAGANVDITVANSTWCTVGQVIYIAGAGYYEVINKPAATTITAKNLETVGGAYATNTDQPATINTGAQISPAGLQGTSGSVAGVAVGGDLTGTLPNPTLAALTANGDILIRAAGANTRLAKGTAGQVLTMNNNLPSWRSVDLGGTTTALGTAALPVAKGGTGRTGVVSPQSTTALNSLLPSASASGDIYYSNGTALARLAKGTDGHYLTLTGGVPAWAAVSATANTTKKFKAVLDANSTVLPGAPVMIIWTDVPGAATWDAFDPDSTYSIPAATWTPGVLGYVFLNVSVTGWSNTGSTLVSMQIFLKRYDVDAATDYTVGYADARVHSTLTGPINLSTVSVVENVGDYFYVEAAVSSGQLTIGSDPAAAPSSFSGFTLP